MFKLQLWGWGGYLAHTGVGTFSPGCARSRGVAPEKCRLWHNTGALGAVLTNCWDQFPLGTVKFPIYFSPSKPRGAIMRCSINLCQWMVLHLCVLWIGMRISVVTESIKFCLRENSNIITVQCSTVDLSSLVYPVISVGPLTVQWFLLMHFKLHLAIECWRHREMWFPLWGSLIGLSVVFASRCVGEVDISKTRSASMGLTQIVLNVLWLNATLKRSARCVCTSVFTVKFCASENMWGKPQVSP